jgi:hypothetical protein
VVGVLVASPTTIWSTIKSEPQKIAEVLGKHQDVQEGQWDIYVEFGIEATNTPTSGEAY